MDTTSSPEGIRQSVRRKYAELAQSAGQAEAGCCGPAAQTSGCCSPGASSSSVTFYDDPGAAALPAEVTGLSLGCGDPVTLASLLPGQTVLDLGSGGGIDCFLAAEKVGPSGRVIGVDMTPEMVERARANKTRLGAENVEFRLGEIEHLPVADGSIDVILSNCVINLSPDKPQVFREAFRVLRPGGRIAVSDIVTNGPLPDEIKRSLSAWAGCVAGALEVDDYIAGLAAAGFEDIQLTPVYFSPEMVAQAVGDVQDEVDLGEWAEDEAIGHSVFSAKITAHKP